MRVLEILSDSNRGGAGVYLENYAANASPDTEIVAALPQGAMMAGRLRPADWICRGDAERGNAADGIFGGGVCAARRHLL